MEPATAAALDTDRLIDITTTGRKSGDPKRLEIWFWRVDGRTFITGSPGRRDWYANLVAHPSFTFHLKESVQADLAATARPITEEAERRTILAQVVSRWDGGYDLDAWMAGSPLVEVDFSD